ncbi:MAG: TRAP transporter substrate-binding protein DctP [Verrucomicrobiota bacterium]|jgi:TRAP-type C4-dicarboxylate transport system substrate-binding protein|nr:TRAP transporter substrate-binding protein DctP [Verrucomicrobiota bacterium]
MKRTIYCALWMMLAMAICSHAAVTLKLATQAPEGSIWMRALNDAKAEIESATSGDVKIKIYPGGIMGTEKDVLFKIRTGQLQGGGFMGYAIEKICPDARALMFPMVFRNYAEVDAVLEKMRPLLAEDARKNGFEALGWTEVGFSYAYSVKPIADLDELRATKVWALDSPMLLELFAAGRISGIPANVTDVLTSLQTGALETVFGPPTAAVAVQWHTRVRYYNTMRLTYAVGGVFVSNVGWKSIPAIHQETVREAFDKHCRLLTPKVRKSDLEALDFMQAQGVQPLEATPETYEEFVRIADAALEKGKGAVFSEETWDALQLFLLNLRTP